MVAGTAYGRVLAHGRELGRSAGRDPDNGELYATDRDEIPAGIPSHNSGKIIGVWRLPMTVSFGKVSLRVRNNRAAVNETDRIRLYLYDGTEN